MNEILASDYLIPMRLLAPAKAQESGAGFMESGVTDMADWNRQMQSVVAQHRRDPDSMHTLWECSDRRLGYNRYIRYNPRTNVGIS